MNINWLKLDINILDNTKIKLIRKYPDGDSIIILWLGLMCFGMKSDEPGIIKIADGLPYTTDELATIFEIPVKTVQLGLELFCKYGMIQSTEGGLMEIVGFREQQSIDEIEYKRALTRNRVNKFRAKKQELLENGKNKNVTRYSVTSNEQRREEKRRKEKNRKEKNNCNILFPSSLDNNEFKQVWDIWASYRKEIKKKLTPTMSAAQLSKLEKFGSDIAIAMIKQSIEMGWQGLFPIKDNKKQYRGNEKAIEEHLKNIGALNE